MSQSFYKLSKLYIVVLYIVLTIIVVGQGYYQRAIIFTLCCLAFYFITNLYQKRKGFFTVSYLFLLIIFTNFVGCPFYYTSINLLKITTSYSTAPLNDYFNKYAIAFLILAGILIFYLYKSRKIRLPKFGEVKIRNNSSLAVVIPSILLLGVMLLTRERQTFYGLFIMPFSFFVITFLAKGFKKDNWVILGLLMGAMAIFQIYQMRFVVLQYALPIALALIIACDMKGYRMKSRHFVVLVILFFLAIICYGIISNVVKLNVSYGGNYVLKEVLTDTTALKNLFEDQIYRIFQIWTKLGAFIIYHTDANGFYYGLTYIKPLAGVLGLPYISLPNINAEYLGGGATYAQPGLFAEGYANFGLIGAVVNILLVFFLMEILFNNFIRNASMVNLILMCAPFCTILLDGGTLNSAIFNIAFGLIAFCVVIATGKHKRLIISSDWKIDTNKKQFQNGGEYN